MSEAVLEGLPSGVSYSQIDSWLTCGKRYQLERVVKVPRAPGIWFPGGTTFHHITELWDRKIISTRVATDSIYIEATLQGFIQDESSLPLDQWDVAKAVKEKKNWPDGENYEWWLYALPKFIQQYIDWREATKWPILEIDGNPAIELELNCKFAGYTLRGYIDRVFVPNGQLMVGDLKTSKREPGSLQLGMYKVALAEQFGLEPEWGVYYNARGGQTWEPQHLAAFTRPLIEETIRQFRVGIEHGVFIPHQSNFCGSCGVRDYCAIVGGSKAAEYDPILRGEFATPSSKEEA